jgi:hypothetical protein
VKARGNCYVTCEALYHLLGGKGGGLTPHTVRVGREVHWYLVIDIRASLNVAKMILDPTRSQFPPGTAIPYHQGRGRGFLTKKPSKRARALMRRLVWQ